MKNSADTLNSRFEMADKRITDPKDSNYPIQGSERRNEIEGQSLRDPWDSIKISL